MLYPETIKYIKKQLKKGAKPSKIKKALEEAGYQLDIIDKLLEKAGAEKSEKKSAGIELVIKNIGIWVILLLIGASLIYFVFLQKPGQELFSPETSKNLELDFTKFKTFKLEKNGITYIDLSKFVKDKNYDINKLKWSHSGKLCINVQIYKNEAEIRSIFFPDCPVEESIRFEVTNPGGENDFDILKVKIT